MALFRLSGINILFLFLLMLLVGLGNPGKEYEQTRHNAGWWILDHYVQSRGGKREVKSQWRCVYAQCETEYGVVHCIKPQTFMNRSGESVLAICRALSCKISDIVVLHDDLERACGVRSPKDGGGMAGHNGLRSIAHSCGSPAFARVRIGIERPTDAQSVADYVLDRPTAAQYQKIMDCADPIKERVDNFYQNRGKGEG